MTTSATMMFVGLAATMGVDRARAAPAALLQDSLGPSIEPPVWSRSNSARSARSAFSHTLSCEQQSEGVYLLTAGTKAQCIQQAGIINAVLAECAGVAPSLGGAEAAEMTCTRSNNGLLLSASPCEDTFNAVVAALDASERLSLLDEDGDALGASDGNDDDKHARLLESTSGSGSANDGEAAEQAAGGLVPHLSYTCLEHFGLRIIHGTDFDTCNAEANRIGLMMERYEAGTFDECVQTTPTTTPTITTSTTPTTTPTTSPVTGTLTCAPSGRAGESFLAAESGRCDNQVAGLGTALRICQDNGVGKVTHTNQNFVCGATPSLGLATISSGGICKSIVSTVNSMLQQVDGDAAGDLYCKRGSRKLRVLTSSCNATVDRLNNMLDMALLYPGTFDCATTTPTTTPTSSTTTTTATTTTVTTDTGTLTTSQTTVTSTSATSTTTVPGPALRCRELSDQVLIVADEPEQCPVQLQHINAMLGICRSADPSGGGLNTFAALDLSCFTRAATSFAVVADGDASCPKAVDQLNSLLSNHYGSHAHSAEKDGAFRCTFDGLLTFAPPSPVHPAALAGDSTLHLCTASLDKLLATTNAHAAGEFTCVPPTTTTRTTTTTATATTTSQTFTTKTATSTTATETSVTATSVTATTKTTTTTATVTTATATTVTGTTTTTNTATTVTETTFTDTTTTMTGTTTTTIDLSCPANCCAYFDGCNACSCEGGFRTQCTQRVCESTSAPICLQQCPETTATTATTATITTATTATTAAPSFVNLLGNAGTPQVCFKGGANEGFLVANAPSFGSAFTLSFAVSVTPRRPGYLFSRASTSGFRHISAYIRSKNRGMIIYYKTKGSMQQKSARFSFNDLGDGKQHGVVLVVSADDTATLAVDGVPVGTRSLGGPIDDCSAASPGGCITHIGRRAGGFPMTGCVHSASFSLPDTSGNQESSTAFDMLDGSNHAGNSAASGSRCFDASKSPAIQLSSFPAASPATEMIISTVFTVSAGSYGYLYSKGGANSRRDYAIYLRRSDAKLVLYYRTVGNAAQQKRVLFTDTILRDTVFPSALDKPAVIEPGPTYTLVVSFAGKKIHAVLTATSSSGTAKAQFRVSLPNVIDDCGGAEQDDCTFNVGERLGGYKLKGACLLSAVVE